MSQPGVGDGFQGAQETRRQGVEPVGDALVVAVGGVEILQQIIFRISDDCNKQIAGLDNSGLSNLQKIESVTRFHIQMMLHRFEDYHVMINEWIHLEAQPLADFISQRRIY